MAHVGDVGFSSAVCGGQADEERPERTASPTDRVHNASGGGPRLGLDLIVERCKDPGVVTTLARTEGRHGGQQHWRGGTQTDHRHEDRPHQKPRSLHDHSPARHLGRQPVGGHARQWRAHGAREMDEERGVEPGGAERIVEFLNQKCWRPRQEDRGHKIRSEERKHEQNHRRLPKHQSQRVANAEWFAGGVRERVAGGHHFRSIGGTALRLPQKEIKHRCHHEAQASKYPEAHPPSVPLGQHRAEPAAENRAEIDARLVDGKRAAAGGGAVVVAHQRHR